MDTRSFSFGDLIGETIGQYRVVCPIKETSKSLVFEAIDNLDRDVALKILKPGQSKARQEQFLREGKRLAAIGKHEKITTVYAAGQQNGFSYIAMELVRGNDLEEAIKSGRKFSLDEILRIITSVVEAVSYSRSKDVQHHDIKLANVKAREKGSYVLDFGDRLSVDANYDDNFAIGEVFEELLKNCDSKVPRSLEEIVRKAKHFSYSEPEEIGIAITGYRRSVNRRRFLKGVGAVGALAGLGYFGKRHFDYEGSIEKVVHEIERAKEKTTEETKDLFGELLNRIVNNKVRWLVESGKISRGKFPYATTSDGSWFLTDGGYWSDGFWPGILWTAYETTKDEKFKKWADEWTKAIKFDGKSDGCNDVRFYYSHAKAFDVTGEAFYREEALKAAERFSEFILGSFSEESKKCEISTNTMLFLPFFVWANRQTNKPVYYNIVNKQAEATQKFNLRDDGSTREIAVFDSETFSLLDEKSIYTSKPCFTHAKGQAAAISGFSSAYSLVDDIKFLKAAEILAGYFLTHLDKDLVPTYEFNEVCKIRDSSAAAIASSALLDLYDLTNNTGHLGAAKRIIESLSSENYLSMGLGKYQGILRHGCTKIGSPYSDSSLIQGDYFYLDALKKLKNKKRN